MWEKEPFKGFKWDVVHDVEFFENDNDYEPYQTENGGPKDKSLRLSPLETCLLLFQSSLMFMRARIGTHYY